MSNSFNTPRLGLGFSEDQRAALQRVNRLKQELYAQQKKIQFSNLLERSSQDIDSYVESQNNVFILSGRANDNSRSERQDGESTLAENQSSRPEATSEIDNVDANDDRDGMDFFLGKAFRANADRSDYRRASSEDDSVVYEPAAPATESLRDHLISQLELDGKFASLDRQVKKMAFKIIDSLDADGYLKPETDFRAIPVSTPESAGNPDEVKQSADAVRDFDDAFGIHSTNRQRFLAKKALEAYFSEQSGKEARAHGLVEFEALVGRKTTREEREVAKRALEKIQLPEKKIDPLESLFTKEDQPLAKKALDVVQSLDPPGVGARSLRESLLLRLRPDAEYAEALRGLISNFFDDFIKKRLGALAKKSGVTHNELMKIYAAPFPFYPSPGELFANASAPARAIYPEIIVERGQSGRWVARLDESLANIELDPLYQKMLFSKRVDKKTREYLRRQYVEAQALMDALRNRNSTLLRVAKAVVDFQEEYFSNPSTTPKPLTQQQIADKLGLDTSTVSRACNDKWLSTPRGYVPFKDFFPKAVVGEVTSVDVAEKIRALIANESPNSPLSDEELAAELKRKFDVKVSRKTVQEHREQLRIPNSRVRKRIKSGESAS